MKNILFIFIAFIGCLPGKTQVVCSAGSDSGSGYAIIENAGLAIEDPDCVHADFGAHITQTYDADLNRNVFVFHSHINEDNDRCIVFDRVRMEIKGGPGTSAELQHPQGSESFYRWKFRLNDDFIGASTFNHIFQNKAFEGDDAGFPILTITPRVNTLEVRHNGGNTGNDLGALVTADLDLFRGKWIEAFLRQKHNESGELEVTLRDMQTGRILLEYINLDIDLWRTGSTYNRPKWGMYRAKNSILKDEEIRFSDFCVTETDVQLCPAEAVFVPDTVAPTAPINLSASAVSMTDVNLTWEASSDLYGVTAYDVLQDGSVVQTVSTLWTSVNNLIAATNYTFTVVAKDEVGNISLPSNALTITTDAANVLPETPFNPTPDDGAANVSILTTLNWRAGSNTDRFQIFIGENNPPPLVNTQVGTSYRTPLSPTTTYFWKIVATNANGETSSPIWEFTTGAENADFPWQVFRGNDRPETETNFLDLNEAPVAPPVDEIIADPNGSTNNFFGFRSNSAEEFRWRHLFDPADSSVTVVVRLQAVNPDVNGICYLEVRNGGWRQKVRINQSTLKLEKTSPEVEVDLPFDITGEMHLFRVVSTGQNTTIYLDENPNPIASGISDTPSAGAYFEWGKSGGIDYGAYIDWLAMDKTGLFAPGEGTDLPGDLFLSSDASLSELNVDGAPLANFASNIFDYTVKLPGTDVPSITWETSSNLAIAMVANPMTVPNSQAIITVTAQDGFTDKEYTITYESTSNSKEVFDRKGFKIFPIPAGDELQIDLGENQKGRVDFYSLDGKKMQMEMLPQGNSKIDVSKFPKGIYFLKIQFESDEFFIEKIVLK